MGQIEQVSDLSDTNIPDIFLNPNSTLLEQADLCLFGIQSQFSKNFSYQILVLNKEDTAHIHKICEGQKEIINDLAGDPLLSIGYQQGYEKAINIIKNNPKYMLQWSKYVGVHMTQVKDLQHQLSNGYTEAHRPTAFVVGFAEAMHEVSEHYLLIQQAKEEKEVLINAPAELREISGIFMFFDHLAGTNIRDAVNEGFAFQKRAMVKYNPNLSPHLVSIDKVISDYECEALLQKSRMSIYLMLQKLEDTLRPIITTNSNLYENPHAQAMTELMKRGYLRELEQRARLNKLFCGNQESEKTEVQFYQFLNEMYYLNNITKRETSKVWQNRSNRVDINPFLSDIGISVSELHELSSYGIKPRLWFFLTSGLFDGLPNESQRTFQMQENRAAAFFSLASAFLDPEMAHGAIREYKVQLESTLRYYTRLNDAEHFSGKEKESKIRDASIDYFLETALYFELLKQEDVDLYKLFTTKTPKE
ncbi:hypothetical protein HGA88_01545 [Candidatus Roizmanbacteria bacterium]|nr:hypothetical protein [Candidatus Roizmanbacteria bacterium]